MLTIDGARGEGGGQILRSALALSLVTGTPFSIRRIRAARARPGLMRQHLTAVLAAAKVGRVDVEGLTIGSSELVFRPKAVEPGDYRFAIGTAGSAMLVLQTILPPLMLASGPSTVTLEGGTHNIHAPPFDFLAKAFLPIVARMGAKVGAELQCYGFYPAGGGKCVFHIEPAGSLRAIELMERGEIVRRSARSIVSNLPRHIGERELRVVSQKLGWSDDCLHTEMDSSSPGPGNVLMLEIESEHVTEVSTGFGAIGVPAETVAEQAVDEAKRYLAAGAPVGEHLADQLLVPMALAGGGAFRTMPLTRHSTTNIEVIQMFLDVKVDAERAEDRSCAVRVSR